MAAASSGDPKVQEDGEEELENGHESVWPLDNTLDDCEPKESEDVEEELDNGCGSAWPVEVVKGTKNPPRYTALHNLMKGAEIHNLWHYNQFTEPKEGHVTCTLCGVTFFAGQEATHGRGRRHSAKARDAGMKPSAQCRGFKWCCWCGCPCQRWYTRSH